MDLTDNTSSNTLDSPTNLNKKRGRPRKKPLEYEKSEANCSTSENPNPAPKRGRPRRSNQKQIETEPESDKNVVISSSSRGRKRRELNYSLMESGFLADVEPPAKKRKTLKSIVSESTKDKHIDDKEVVKQDISPTQDSLSFSSDTGNVKSEDIDGLYESDRLNDSNDSSNKKLTKSNRYNYTGNTVKMLKQVFQAAQSGSSNDDKNKSTSGNDSVIENDSVTCMVCNQMIGWSEWSYHKRKIHYNLAWRNGETPLDIHNDHFVMSTLKDLLREQNKLKCHRCGERTAQAKDFFHHLELCTGIVTVAGTVTCAVCKSTLSKTEWPYHKYKFHNNLAWRVGDVPLDLNDQSLVIRILNQLYKSKKPLNCEKCGISKKSVVGFLSHKSTCQKSGEELEEVKVQCEVCFKKFLPVSLDYHMKTAHGPAKTSAQLDAQENDRSTVQTDQKRKAAQKALVIINKYGGDKCTDELEKNYITNQHFDKNSISSVLKRQLDDAGTFNCKFPECNYTDTELDKITSHMENCDKKPSEFFACKNCLAIFEHENEIAKHLQTEHKLKIDENFEIEDDEVLEDNESYFKQFIIEEKRKLQKNACHKVKPIFLHGRMSRSINQQLYPFSYEWMLEFSDTNYSKNELYPDMYNESVWPLLDCDILERYLPETYKSCYVTAKLLTKDDSDGLEDCPYKRIDLFEHAKLCEGDTTIFCGGPVNAMAWMPTPYNETHHTQILAVSCFKGMNDRYLIDENYTSESVILLWDFGVLKNKEDRPAPSLFYGIGLNVGPIWDMAWCPSGCFEPRKRMGLLAVAASDSFVHILPIQSVPEEEQGSFYKGRSKLKLQLNSGNTSEIGKYYPVKISWTKASGHRYVAVAYSNGIIGMFDLNTDSILLRRTSIDGDEILFPYLTFQGHGTNITGMTLSHLNGGNRWLVTSSFDREVTWWDLNSLDKSLSVKNCPVSDCVWMTQWLCCAMAEDESCTVAKGSNSMSKPLRDFLTEPMSLTLSKSGIKSLSFSDWLNGLLHGSIAGEIVAVFPDQMLHLLDRRKECFKKSLLSYARVTEKCKTEREMTDCTYESTVENYALSFFDYELKAGNNLPTVTQDSDKLGTSSLEVYPLQKINKVLFNPNPQACTYFVAGYQSGFVRLKQLSFLTDEKQIL